MFVSLTLFEDSSVDEFLVIFFLRGHFVAMNMLEFSLGFSLEEPGVSTQTTMAKPLMAPLCWHLDLCHHILWTPLEVADFPFLFPP